VFPKLLFLESLHEAFQSFNNTSINFNDEGNFIAYKDYLKLCGFIVITTVTYKTSRDDSWAANWHAIEAVQFDEIGNVGVELAINKRTAILLIFCLPVVESRFCLQLLRTLNVVANVVVYEFCALSQVDS